MKRITRNELRDLRLDGHQLKKILHSSNNTNINDNKHVNLMRSIALKIFHIREKIFKNSEIQGKEL